jgi:uncharacterized protein
MKMKTLILGASNHPDRYSYLAIKRLIAAGYGLYAVGSHEGKIGNVSLLTQTEDWDDIDTVTIYLQKKNQSGYYDYLIRLKPRRVIFNPGAENKVLEDLLSENGVEVLNACTLVMLSTGQY